MALVVVNVLTQVANNVTMAIFNIQLQLVNSNVWQLVRLKPILTGKLWLAMIVRLHVKYAQVLKNVFNVNKVIKLMKYQQMMYSSQKLNVLMNVLQDIITIAKKFVEAADKVAVVVWVKINAWLVIHIPVS